MQHQKSKKCAISLLLPLVLLFSAQAADIAEVIPIGRAVGIQMSAQGVLVVRLDDVQTAQGAVCPARGAGMEEGDVIVRIGQTTVDSNDDLQTQVARSGGKPLQVEAERDGQTVTFSVTPVRDSSGAFRLGILARDSMAGIGTLTYVDPETGACGALGHGVCDSDTGVLLPLQQGSLIRAAVGSVQRGKVGEPGALQGDFSASAPIGTVSENTDSGIFGTLTDSAVYSSLPAIPAASADEIRTGEAEILSNIEDDSVQRYSVQIVKVYPADDEYGRGMMLRVTDPALLEKTGGIVQGMSGSPVLQNGKLIGAVTHVLVNDPTCGYAIGIEKMLREMTN